MFPVNKCMTCKHYALYPKKNMRGCPYCDAFPNGIPKEIWWEKRDHAKPCHGDHGIRYEPAHPDD